jgi:hypothetical protein
LNGVRALQAEPILQGLLPESREKIRYAGTTIKRSMVLVQGDGGITRCVSRSRMLHTRSGQGLEGDGLMIAGPHVCWSRKCLTASLSGCLHGRIAQSRPPILSRLLVQPCGSSTPFLDAFTQCGSCIIRYQTREFKPPY